MSSNEALNRRAFLTSTGALLVTLAAPSDWAAAAINGAAARPPVTGDQLDSYITIDRDGTGLGYDIELTRAVSDAVPVPVIASGGAGAIEHFAEALDEGHADAVLAASRFHFEELTIADVKRHLADRGIPVRLT